MNSSMDVFNTAREAAHAAFLASTLDGDGLEARLDASLAAYRAVLTTAGCLTAPHLAPTDDDLDRAARLLAERSECERYRGKPDSWRILRESSRHVMVAYTMGLDRLKHGEPGVADALTAAKCLLIQHAPDGVEEAAGSPA